jgi:chemotaxis protein methyltransferase CheR
MGPGAGGVERRPGAPAARDRLLRLLEERAGLAFPGSRRELIDSALARTALARGRDPARLAESILSGDAPLQPLVEELTVGETYFFRDPAQWQLVERVIVPEARARRRGRALRAWSAGCSTGEEPYTLAALLEELGLGGSAHLVATDLSEAALARARRGEYSLWSFRGGADARLRRHLRAVGGGLRLDAELVRRVRFFPLNLAAPGYPSSELGLDDLDLVLCRNVLIYLTSAAVRDIAPRLFASLAPGGWLVTGPSDPLLARYAPFTVEAGEHGIAYRRPESVTGASRAGAPRPAAPPRSGAAPRPGPSAPAPPIRRAPPARAFRHPACLECRQLLDAGHLPEARSAIEGALARSPLDPELHLMRALVLTELHDLPGAEGACRRALYLDPDLLFAHFFLGMLRLHAGDPASARRRLRNALAASERRPPAEEVPLSGGLSAGALARAARYQLDALGGA